MDDIITIKHNIIPYFTLATRTIRLDCLIKLPLSITRSSPSRKLISTIPISAIEREDCHMTRLVPPSLQ